MKLALYAASLTALLALPQIPPRLQAPAGRLTLDVAAVDNRGAPVVDLRPEEFEIWIGGFRVPVDEVAFVTPDSSPRTVVVLLDNAAVGPDLASRVKGAARSFVNAAGDRDRIAIVPLHGDRTELTTERATLLQAIDSYRLRGFPFRIEDAGEHVLRLLTSLARQMTEQPGRKTIVAIGAAWMFDTPLPPPGLRDLHQEWLGAMRAMAAANASLYVIDPVGLRALPGLTYGGASGFARETGGHAFVNTNDLEGAAAKILAESGTYYLLRMADPPVQRTADLREVQVKVLRKGITARSRRGIPGK